MCGSKKKAIKITYIPPYTISTINIFYSSLSGYVPALPYTHHIQLVLV